MHGPAVLFNEHDDELVPLSLRDYEVLRKLTSDRERAHEKM